MPLALSALLGATRAHAVEVELSCDRLDDEERDELTARSQLLLESSKGEREPDRVVIACDDERSWVDCSRPLCMDRHSIDERSGLVEGALDALERMMSGVRQRGAELPADETDELDAPSRRQRDEPPGGIGLALVGELVPGRDTAIGPRLDVGFGVGSFTGFASEGFRAVTKGSEGLLLIDTQLGVAWGAPFAPAHDFGAAASAGIEWLTTGSAGRDASSGQTDSSVIGTIGARARIRLGAAALWAGLDLRARARPERLGSPIDLELPPATVLVSAGALWLVAGAPD